jgi:hypothetical protein
MGAFYSDEQVQEAIALVEKEFPGTWENMKKLALVAYPLNEEQQKLRSAISRALIVVLPKVSFIAKADDEATALGHLIVDVGNAVRAAVGSAAGSF